MIDLFEISLPSRPMDPMFKYHPIVGGVLGDIMSTEWFRFLLIFFYFGIGMAAILVSWAVGFIIFNIVMAQGW